MAARVTKLFLQNCASAKEDVSKSTKRSSAKNKTSTSYTTLSKSARKKRRQKSKKVSGRSQVKLLEEARRELAQADRTVQNLRKLKSRAPVKSQRLMEKVGRQYGLTCTRLNRSSCALTILLLCCRLFDFRSLHSELLHSGEAHGPTDGVCRLSWRVSSLSPMRRVRDAG